MNKFEKFYKLCEECEININELKDSILREKLYLYNIGAMND